jgi:hypothetical protein
MNNLILTPALLEVLNQALAQAQGDAAAATAGQFDSKLPSHYFSQMSRYAAGFNKWEASAPVAGISFDSAEPKWDFHFPGITHFDGTESMFIARMLEFIRPGVYAKKYPMLLWSQHVPANYDVPTGAEAYTVTGSDYVGEVKLSRMPATNANMVNHSVFQGSMGFFSMVLGYEYNLQEVRNAIFAGQPLQTKLAVNCRNLMERKLDEIAYLGEKAQAVKGLLNLAGTGSYATPATGAGGLKSWDAKNSEDILRDLNGPVDQMIVSTNSISIPNAWLMPVSRSRVIETRRAADGTDTTVKSFFLKNQKFITEITTTYRSEASTDGFWVGKRGVVYRNDAETLEMIINQPFEQMAPVAMHMTVTTLCHLRTGGLALYAPQEVIYVDEI